MHVGQIVRIRTDLKPRYDYNGEVAVDYENIMGTTYGGQLATITKIFPDGIRLKLDIDDARWTWTSEMFLPPKFTNKRPL